MDRRKFLIGAGSFAAAGAGAIGTGAFTSVRADRKLKAQVASDNEAYLALDASVSEYAEETGNTVEFQFNDEAGATGDGLNANADSLFNDVLRVENQGTQPVRLQVGSSVIGSLPDGPLAVAFTDESNAGDGAVANWIPFASSPHPSYWSNSPNVNNQDVGVGQDLYVHFAFYLNSNTSVLDSNLDSPPASQSPNQIPNRINFYAGATSTNATDFS